MVEIGDTLTINRLFKVFRKFPDGSLDVCDEYGNCLSITSKDISSNMQLMKDVVRTTADRLLKANNQVTTLEIKVEVRKTHPQFYWIQNGDGTVVGVSDYMNELAIEGKYNFVDNGGHRIYTKVGAPVASVSKRVIPKKAANKASKTATPAPIFSTTPVVPVKRAGSPRTPRITRTKAFDLMQNNKGHFFTAVFTKKDGTERTINCQFMKDQTQTTLGYVKVRETGKLKTGVNAVRQINIQTLKALKIGGQNYIVK